MYPLRVFSEIAVDAPLYEINASKAKISSGLCTKNIGEGNNLIDDSVTYKSKCEGDGLGPKIVYDMGGNAFLSFTTSGKPNDDNMLKTRSELAFTDPERPYFQFGKDYYISFKLKIPDNSTQVNINKSFYVLQFWQCAGASPIAGIRLAPPNKHSKKSTTNINFMTRGDFSEGSTVHFNITNNEWTQFIVKVNVNPRKGKGQFIVWKNINEVKVETHNSYGYFNKSTCTKNKRPEQHFRIKFGIYKDYEKGKKFTINFDDVLIGETFDSVLQ